MKIATYLISLVLLVSNIKGYGQEEYRRDKSFTAAALQEDFAILRKALETTYPSLYRFTDSLNMSKYLDHQYTKLDKPMTETEFYKVIALTCASANDEHLIPNPSEGYEVYLKNAAHYFPFSLKIIDRRLYVRKTFQLEGPLPVGAEILSINGHSAEEILNILLPTIPSDGYLQTFNIRHLEDYCVTQNRNLFDLNYPIFLEDTTSFRIAFTHPVSRSEKKMVTVPAIDHESYKEFYWQRMAYKAPLEFKYLGRVAYLRISSFIQRHRDDFNQDFYALYDSIFHQLKENKTKSMVLDLRNNEGGDAAGEKLIRYLLTEPYVHYKYTEVKYSGYPAVADYLQGENDGFIADSVLFQTSSGKYRIKEKFYNGLFDQQEPMKNHFKGTVYVLANGATGSMASVVATFLKSHNRAIFIGEETGGAMEGNTSEAYVQLRLPNTKIRIEIPLVKKGNNVDFVKGRGVIPDYFITPDIEDISKGIDTELNFVLDLISIRKY